MASARTAQFTLRWIATVGNLRGVIVAFLYFRVVDHAASRLPPTRWIDVVVSIIVFALMVGGWVRLSGPWTRPLNRVAELATLPPGGFRAVPCLRFLLTAPFPRGQRRYCFSVSLSLSLSLSVSPGLIGFLTGRLLTCGVPSSLPEEQVSILSITLETPGVVVHQHDPSGAHENVPPASIHAALSLGKA